jgi:hypothetical protein
MTSSLQRPAISRILSACRKSQRAYEPVARLGEKLISDLQTDAQVIVGSDDFLESGDSGAFVAFRGTTSAADWGMNSRVWLVPSTLGGGAKVHSGFAMQWASVKSRVFDELEQIGPDRILLTGHSLGGACAMIASTDIIERFPGVPVEMITFGAPRCGNTAYSERVAKNVSVCTRVVHDNDIVPSMPTVALGYAHSATPWLHIMEGDSKPDTKLVWKKPADGWWFEMRARFARLLSFDGISDHHISHYVSGCGGDRKAE